MLTALLIREKYFLKSYFTFLGSLLIRQSIEIKNQNYANKWDYFEETVLSYRMLEQSIQELLYCRGLHTEALIL